MSTIQEPTYDELLRLVFQSNAFILKNEKLFVSDSFTQASALQAELHYAMSRWIHRGEEKDE